MDRWVRWLWRRITRRFRQQPTIYRPRAVYRECSVALDMDYVDWCYYHSAEAALECFEMQDI